MEKGFILAPSLRAHHGRGIKAAEASSSGHIASVAALVLSSISPCYAVRIPVEGAVPATVGRSSHYLPGIVTTGTTEAGRPE